MCLNSKWICPVKNTRTLPLPLPTKHLYNDSCNAVMVTFEILHFATPTNNHQCIKYTPLTFCIQLALIILIFEWVYVNKVLRLVKDDDVLFHIYITFKNLLFTNSNQDCIVWLLSAKSLKVIREGLCLDTRLLKFRLTLFRKY